MMYLFISVTVRNWQVPNSGFKEVDGKREYVGKAIATPNTYFILLLKLSISGITFIPSPTPKRGDILYANVSYALPDLPNFW